MKSIEFMWGFFLAFLYLILLCVGAILMFLLERPLNYFKKELTKSQKDV